MLKFLFLILLSSTSPAATIESVKVKTARGVEVDAALHFPDHLTGKAPTVVIAPGQGYHMDLPIVRRLADTLAARGLIAVRFNWNYFSSDPQNGQPSDNLSKEIEDMQSVVSFAKTDPRIDSSQLILAGKSLGSLVSNQVFSRDLSAKALLLLTPVCTASYDDNDQLLPAPIPSGAKNYPNLTSETRPVTLVLGSSDPLCQLPMLFDFLKDTRGNVAAAVVGGNHSWNLSKETDPESQRRNAENIEAGVAIAAQWINLWLSR